MTGNRALSLYRNILRSHSKNLPTELRQLGDAYVKSEFRLFRNVTESTQLDSFFSEWDIYLERIKFTADQSKSMSMIYSDDDDDDKQKNSKDSLPKFSYGADLRQDDLQKLEEEKMLQLEKLKEEATNLGKGN